MNEKLSPKNIKEDKFTSTNENSDYQNLIIRLQEISKTINLLEKIIFK